MRHTRSSLACFALVCATACSRPASVSPAPEPSVTSSPPDAAPPVVFARDAAPDEPPPPAATDLAWMDYVQRALTSCKSKTRNALMPGPTLSPTIDDASLAVLAVAVREKDPKSQGGARDRDRDVRECLVDVVDGVGRHANHLELVRDRRLVALLVARLAERPSLVRDTALGYLREHVPPAALREHGDELVAALASPDGTLFYALAKAKIAEAAPRLEEIARRPELAREESITLARAALGREDLERPYVERFLSAPTGEEKAAAARTLGAIGTPRALAALCTEMRTPLRQGDPHVIVRSVRLDLIDALRYDLPEDMRLLPAGAPSEAFYDAVEAFCRDRFGTTWSASRPPFFVEQGGPMPRTPTAH